MSRRLVGFSPGAEEEDAVEPGGSDIFQGFGQGDDRLGQHAAEQVVKRRDRAPHGFDNCGMRVTEDRAHLPGGEVEHAPAARVIDERSLGGGGDEVGELPPVSYQRVIRALA